MDLFEQKFIDFLKLFHKHEVDYIIIGGYAVNFYGYNRPTGDMDLFVKPTNENKIKIGRAIDEFGYDATELLEKDFEKPDVIFVDEPPFRIDLLNKIVGIDFDEAFERRNFFDLEGMKINVLHLNDLRVNKLISGRHKDLDDLENLNKIHPA